ncbi:MAG: hypothetical protein NTX72_02990 [Candidatus Uhrbacteria bacterium]|nr:hypothetical protein [Candidatus Uhrbacteria bacterium]
MKSSAYSFCFTDLITIVSILLGLFYTLDVSHVGANEIGIFYDTVTGKMTTTTAPGWHITHPLVFERSISTLPIKVEIRSEAKIINQKLVRFKPEGVQTFLSIQGFPYTDRMDDVMMGYAFSGKTFSFLEIVEDSTPPR